MEVTRGLDGKGNRVSAAELFHLRVFNSNSKTVALPGVLLPPAPQGTPATPGEMFGFRNWEKPLVEARDAAGSL